MSYLLRLCHISWELHSCFLHFNHLSCPIFCTGLKAFIKSPLVISDVRDPVASGGAFQYTQVVVTEGGARLLF